MIVRQGSVESIPFGGLQIHDYTEGRATSSSLAVVHVPPGADHPESYSRRSDKYYYILAGRLRFALDGQEHDLTPGDFCLVGQGQRFWYENRGQEPAVLLLVHTPCFDVESEVFMAEGVAS